MLPLTRNTTYTPASPVLSEDLNDFQDCISARSHGSIVHYLRINPDYNPGSNTVAWLIDLPVGSVVRSVQFSLFGNGADDLTVSLESNTLDDTAESSIDSQAFNDQIASYGAKTWDCDDSLVEAAAVNGPIVLKMVGTGPFAVVLHDGNLVLAGVNLKIKGVRVTYDKPL